MATSGTVGTTVFKTRRVIDHAFRRCKLTPQQVTAEMLDTALDLLFLELSALANRGIPLWTVNRFILPLYESQFSVPSPVGTVDVFEANLRVNVRPVGVASSSEGTANSAFDADLDTACTQTAAAGFIQLEYEEDVAIPIFGLLPNATGTWDVSFQYSDDGIAWTTIFTESALDVVAGEWFWRDVEGVTCHLFYRLQANGATVLDVTELVFHNTPREIPMYKMNRDEYNSLPNKTRTGRPVQFWYDKTRTQPILTLWPVPEFQYTFAQATGFLHRQIQDVGTLRQELEVPQRWYLAIMLQLAKHLCKEIKEVDPNMIPIIQSDAAYELKRAWDGESDGSRVTLLPRISPYTR